MKKNILVVTPYYPFPELDRLRKNTKAVYYLCNKGSSDENIIIVNYYQHARKEAYANFCGIIKKNNYKDCLYQDDLGHDVLLFESPLLIPHHYKPFAYFDKLYAKMFKNYLQDKGIEIDSVVVHFPLQLNGFAKRINANKKIAIIHNFDVQDLAHTKKTRSIIGEYSKIGFRSKCIEEKLDFNFNNSFLCLSGVPDEMLDYNTNIFRKKNDGINLIFAGNLDGNKNVITVLKALNKLKGEIDFSYTVIGDGPEKQGLIQYVMDNGLSDKVKFLGRIPREKVIEEMKKSDVFVMTSFYETLGISYFEAVATGNIIIGSIKRGVYGIFEDNTSAFFVDPYSTDELARVIIQIHKMGENEANAMRQKAYNVVKELSETNVSRRYLSEVIDMDS